MSKKKAEIKGQVMIYAISIALILFLPLVAATKAAVETYLFLLAGVIALIFWKSLRLLVLKNKLLKGVVLINYFISLIICSFSFFYEYHIPMLMAVAVYMFSFKAKIIKYSEEMIHQKRSK
ncbi:hypothetical protein [Pseudoalteromonas rhizosphaerae]|uniref:hypothetical protein n=1 Tax=Pseudoalteromonas rhizosphaerae TaxID=2518973 RepID=UPI0012313E9D|nr:hypothetical protein [Pseudoalteromonas rhizosphaerae]